MKYQKTFIIILFLLLNSSFSYALDSKNEIKQKFNDYWYSSKAEISSYDLSQARYGKNYKGHSVLVFVTESFLPLKQVKADSNNKNNIPILKLNEVKKFNTGIYPYSLMTSVFSPITKIEKTKINHPLKISFSMQEWCGNTYMQLNNKEVFNIKSYSYFEKSGDKNIELEKNILENEIWTLIRLDPANLPLGNINIIPSFEYLTQTKKEIKAYKANAFLIYIDSLDGKSNLRSYKITYPELKRSITINFSDNFPYIINSWEEAIYSSINEEGITEQKNITQKTNAKIIKTIKTDYWNKNRPVDDKMRTYLGIN